MSKSSASKPSAPAIRRRRRTGLILLVAWALTLLGLVIPSQALGDVTSSGVTLGVNYGTEKYNGTTVVEPGVAYEASLTYDMSQVTPGSSVTLTFPADVSLSGPPPAGNSVVDSVTFGGGTMTVTFKSTPDPTIQQGFLDFQFTFAAPASGSTTEDVTWKLDSGTDSTTVIVKGSGDVFNPGITSGLAKTVADPGLSGKVSYAAATGLVTVDPSITSLAIPYTLTVGSAADATNVTVADTIDDHLAYDPASFSAELVTWDSDGLNKRSDPFPLPGGQPTFAGQGFTLAGLDLPAQSQLVIRYTAHVDDVSGLQTALQAKAAAVDTSSGGDYTVDLDNTASASASGSDSATVAVRGHINAEPQPGPGSAFTKRSSLAGGPVELDPNGDGVLEELPLAVSYTLNADLTQFDTVGLGYDGKYALTQDVVITDTLPQGVVWTGVPTATVNGGAQVLTPVASVAALSGAGEYVISGRTLSVDVGRDVTQKWKIQADASITDVSNLSPSSNTGDPQLSMIYTVKNTAAFAYTDGRGAHTSSSTVSDKLTVRQPNGSHIDDPQAFSKRFGTIPQLTAGQSADIPFIFTLAQGAVVDLLHSEIIDHVDHDVFDVTAGDLADIQDGITGTYGGQGTLSGADFVLTLNSDGDLVITPSSTLGADLPGGQPAAPLDGKLVLNLTLPTKVIQGKQTLDVSNSAIVQGDTKNAYEWDSTATGSATSYGDELEVHKAVYDNGAWSQNLRVPIDQATGLPEESEFIYRVQLIPHGSFAGHAILDITDTLPSETTLIGFVTDANLASGTTQPATNVSMDGNLTATLDTAAGTVLVKQKPGTTLTPGTTPYVNFKVRIDSFTDPDAFVADLGVTNRVGASQATVTPTNGFPLQIFKTDAQRPDMVISDDGARFTIEGPNGFDVEDAVVHSGQVMVKDAGGYHGIVVPGTGAGGADAPVGEYTITETTAPKGYELNSDPVVARINADGSSQAVTIADEPKDLYAIGDYTWIDSDRDGVQDGAEPLLAGVKVELLDASDNDSIVDTTTTDADGHYQFDLLPAGDYKVRFTLTDAQKATYTFTKPLEGGDVATDSDAAPATGETAVIHLNASDSHLVAGPDYAAGEVEAINGIDPTWDAGVVTKSYAVGDYAWVDTNRDGVQGAAADEPVLAGVRVDLTDASGHAVNDVYANPVPSATTDADGHYLFDNLPAGDYRVTFTLSPTDAARYIFTTSPADSAASYTPGDSDATARDADADGTVSTAEQAVGVTRTFHLADDDTALTTTGADAPAGLKATEGIDPTWDAGVVLRSYALGDYTWIDTNRDGVQDAGEPVLPGVHVDLTDQNGDPVDDVYGHPVLQETTGADGHYVFDELPAGDYKVRFTLTDPEQYFTGLNQGAATDDSDADVSSGVTTTITLDSANPHLTTSGPDVPGGLKATEGIDPTWDAGVVARSYAVGDYTWIDTNNDGIQDAGEDPLPDVTVTLTDTSGNPVKDVRGNDVTPVQTAADGHYLFDELPAGDYKLRFELSAADAAKWSFTRKNAGADGGVDSDATPGTGWTEVFTLDHADASLEPAGSYTGGTVNASEGIDPTWDAGVVVRIYPPVTYALGDYVWIDTDRDGVQDAGEAPLAGVTVALLDGTGAVVYTTTTDDEGRYLFDNLASGDYRVRFTLTDGQKATYVFTKPTAGGDTTADSDAGPGTGLSAVFHLGDSSPLVAAVDYPYGRVRATRGIDPTWDAGVVLASVTVGDYVWVDKNKDGRQDSTEPGIPGVVLSVVGPDGKPVTDVYGRPAAPATTDTTGHYLFADLPVLAGGQHYTVVIDRDRSAGALQGYLPTEAGAGDRTGDSSTWQASSAELTVDGAEDLTLDFGFVEETDPGAPHTGRHHNAHAAGHAGWHHHGGTGDGAAGSAGQHHHATPAGGDGSGSDAASGVTLPNTGSNISIWQVGLGLSMIAVGALMLVSRRRRARA